MIRSKLNLNRFTVHQILTQDLDMRKVCAKMVPKNLTTEQKANRGICVVIFWTALRGSQYSSVALSQVMNHGFWSTTPRQNAKVGSGTLQTLPSQESENEQIQNQIDAFFFDSHGIVRKEFVPPGQTVNQTFYRKVLEILRKRVARVRPGIERTWMLHHDNAPCHTAVSINEFLAEKNIPVVPQPPIRWISVPVTSFYSPAQKSLERAPFWYFG